MSAPRTGQQRLADKDSNKTNNHPAELAMTGGALHVQKLAEIKGLSDAKVEKLLDAARKLCASYGWQTAKIMEMQVGSSLSKSSFSWCDVRRCHAA